MTDSSPADAASPITSLSFEELFERHFDAVSRYVVRRLGLRDAEDVVAEVFTVAFRRWDSFEPAHGDGLPWLYGIATNVIRHHRRTEVRMLRAYARTGVHPGVPDRLDDGDMGPALAAALAAMRREHRDALLLHTLADLSYEEVAEAMDVPIGTVRGWIHRARATATRELEQRGIRRRHDDDATASSEVLP